MSKITTTSIRCQKRSCGGWLYHDTDSGEGRLSKYFDRVVLVCDTCGERHSVKVEIPPVGKTLSRT